MELWYRIVTLPTEVREGVRTSDVGQHRQCTRLEYARPFAFNSA